MVTRTYDKYTTLQVVEDEAVEEEHQEVEDVVGFQSILVIPQEPEPTRKHHLEMIDVPRNDLIFNNRPSKNVLSFSR